MKWQPTEVFERPGDEHPAAGELAACPHCGQMEWFLVWLLGEQNVQVRCVNCAAVFNVACWPRVAVAEQVHGPFSRTTLFRRPSKPAEGL